MVEVQYIDGTEDSFETRPYSAYYPWKYMEVEQCFVIPAIEGAVLIPAAFIKCLKHYEEESATEKFAETK